MRPHPEDIEGLAVDRRGAVLDVCLDRPSRRNALTDDMVVGLADLLDAAGSDEEIRVVHLRGSGGDFCSGFDLALRSGEDKPRRTGTTQREMRRRVNRLIPTMLTVQTPIVASVTGHAIGLGLNLALASDFVIAADDARLRSPFVRSGFTPDSGASWLLPRLVGMARAKELLMLGGEISGATAAGWGLIHRSVPESDIGVVSGDVVDRLASGATVALGLTKLLLHRAPTVELERHLEDEALAIELSSRSGDFAEWSRARREGRPTDFGGT